MLQYNPQVFSRCFAALTRLLFGVRRQSSPEWRSSVSEDLLFAAMRSRTPGRPAFLRGGFLLKPLVHPADFQPGFLAYLYEARLSSSSCPPKISSNRDL